MKIIKVVGSILIAVVLLVALAIYFLSSSAHMERSIVIKASAQQVFFTINNFRNFNQWSPWVNAAPDAKYFFEGEPCGVGARVTWQSSDPDVGDGSMEIVESIRNKMVVSVLRFDGYGSNPYSTLSLKEENGQTRVVWAFDEHDTEGLSKLFMLGIDGFLGRDWESGLRELKKFIEAAPKLNVPVDLVEATSFPYIGIPDTIMHDPVLLSTRMAQHYGDLFHSIAVNNLEQVGNPIALINGKSAGTIAFVSGIPIRPIDSLIVDAPVNLYYSYEGLVLKVSPETSKQRFYDQYGLLREFLHYYQFETTANPWEEYVAEGTSGDRFSSFQTIIYYPVQ